MKDGVTIDWLSDMAFETEVNGHKVYLDAGESVGGKNLGPRPKPFMMLALAGCTGMDVVSILKKMRVEYNSFSVKVEGEITEEHPKKFSGMKVIYTIKGKDLSREKVEKAVNLSKERYCGVSANYSDAFPVSHEIIIEE